MNPIKKLLLEYKITRRNVRKEVDDIIEKIELSKKGIESLSKVFLGLKSDDESNSKVIDGLLKDIQNEKMNLKKLKTKKKVLHGDLSNLNYSIKWMETSRCPSATRGVDNRKGYDSNVTYNSDWIKHQSYQAQDLEELSDDVIAEQTEDKKLKRQFINSMMKSLTHRQIEVLELLANGHNQVEIAEILGISQQAVSRIIKRYEHKIKEEGWMLL